MKKILESEARQRIRSKIAKLEKSLKNNTKPTKYRITIEHPAQDPMVFEYDHANWSCEKSLEVIQYPDGHADMKLSGQERMSIQLWTGMEDFDQFRERIYIFPEKEKL